MPRLFALYLVLLGVLGTPASAQRDSAWEVHEPGRLPAWAGEARLEPLELSQELEERNGGELRLQEGRLLRRFQGQELELGCSAAAGAGVLRGLLADPFGLTFIAASNGLFVTSPESPVMAPVRLHEEAPRGAPSSMAFDGERRLWLTTEAGLGVIEPSHGYGRSLEMPAPGPYRLRARLPGAWLVDCGSEAWIYRLDQEPAPRLERVLSGGQELLPDALLEITHGDSLELECEASGAGGAVLRYALDGHHVWSRLGDLGPDIEPGEHLLELRATDHELRSSPSFPLRVRVLYPFYYRSSFVIGLGLGLGALLFALLFARARRADRTWAQGLWPALPRAFVSTVLILVIGLQLLAGAIPHGRGWPFIGYSMYTESRDLGHIAYNGAILGFGKRGVPLPLPLGTLGMAADNRWQILRPILSNKAVAREVMRTYNAKHPDWEQVVRLQVWAKRTEITPEGPLELAPLILSDAVAEPGDGEAPR